MNLFKRFLNKFRKKNSEIETELVILYKMEFFPNRTENQESTVDQIFLEKESAIEMSSPADVDSEKPDTPKSYYRMTEIIVALPKRIRNINIDLDGAIRVNKITYFIPASQ